MLFPFENRDFGGPKWQNFPPAAGSIFYFIEVNGPPQARKNWHFGVRKQGFIRGKWPAAGGKFWRFEPHTKGGKWPKSAPPKTPQSRIPRTPPLVNSEIGDKGGGFGSGQD